MKRIQSLPPSHRPREKILKRGASALTLEELFAVLLVTGTRKDSIDKLAKTIAKLTNNSNELTQETLTKAHIGPSKTAQILAALEIGKRLQSSNLVTLTSPKEVFAQSYEIIHEKKEILLCFYLNARGELLKKETVVIGSLNRIHLLPREIFSLVTDLPVASIILVHNHPSGKLEPSQEDLLFTERVKQAGELLGVTLLDHLIVSKNGWVQIAV